MRKGRRELCIVCSEEEASFLYDSIAQVPRPTVSQWDACSAEQPF